MKQRNGLYMLLLSHFAILSGCIVVASNREPHSRTQFEDIRPHLETLKTGGIKIGNYSVLSVDIKYNHLLVGARDNALLVDLGNINSVESWDLTTQSLGCDKGQDPSCHNYVKLMLPFEERIFICLTRGCIWRNRTNLNAAPGRDSNQNVFIADENYYSTPSQNDTGVITENGRVFTGTINLGTRISMIHGKSFKPRISEVSTDFTSESDFYSDVHFVKSFIIGKYVYIFFRERTMECKSCGKYKVSRVARICKGDYAGQSNLRKYFITYQKAKLVCSDGGEYPVYFNEIQDVWWDSETNLFHAIFTSHPNGPPSSAICVYNLTDVNDVFYTSLFDSREAGNGKWVTVENKFKEYFDGCKVNENYLIPNPRPVPDGMMGTKNMVFSVYKDLLHDPLMHDPVLPTSLDSVQKQGNKAWFVKDGIRMTAIVLDKVGEHTVVYTSTDRGSVLKISQVAGSRQPCLLTEIDLFPINRQEVIKAMTIDPKQHILYFGSDTALTKLRLEQCGSHTHRRSCISASDPYCAWNKETRRCVSVLSSRDSNKLRKGSSTCPKTTEQVAWSPWKTCEGSDGNLCRCQFRPCQDRQNSSCQGGYELRFENCTVNVIVGSEREEWEKYGVQHGNWSAWDTWTDCETKPWVGVRKRTRNCTNPVPRRGGRPCVGEAVQYESCNLGKHEVEKRLLTNPTRSLNLSENKGVHFEVIFKTTGYNISNISVEILNKTFDCEKQRDLCGEGEWKAWRDWGQCSGEGFQIRRRDCKVEPCVGERLQERSCEPTSPSNCKGELDTNSWDVWSVCECNHDLKLPDGSGVRSRQLKCRRDCPNSVECPNTVQYGTCNCRTAVSGRRTDSEETERSKFVSGLAIGLSVGLVVIILVVLGLYCVKRKQKEESSSYSVPKTPEHSPKSDCHYSPIERENGVSTRGRPSSESQSKEDSRNTRKNPCLAFKGFILCRTERAPSESV